jgi:hypothetical protein
LHRLKFDLMIKIFRHYNSKIGPFNFTSGPLINVHELVSYDSDSKKSIYIGEMEEGTSDIRKGRGVAVAENGNMRIGEYTNDGADGNERNVKILDGRCYEGGIMNNLKHGEGTEYFGINSKEGYIGVWKNGKMNGKFYTLWNIFPRNESVYYDDKWNSSRYFNLDIDN